MARKRQPKKKSNNGIWVGSAISGGILLIICVALFFKFQPGPPDRGTGSITEANLAKQTLKSAGLPELGKAPGGNGSLEDLLKEAKAVGNFISAGGVKASEKVEKAKPLIQALHAAAANDMAKGSYDVKIPPKYFDSPEMKSNIGTVGEAVTLTIADHNGRSEFDESQGIAVSYLMLGQKIYESNSRLKARQRGLAIMKGALGKLRGINRDRYEDGEIEKDERNERNAPIMEWDKAIGALETVWNSKFKSTDSVNAKKGLPNITDLIKIANEDEDLSFRIWAARRLGYALYERGDQGNQTAIKAAIESLKSDSDKQVAKAAEEGESIKDADEYYELRKY